MSRVYKIRACLMVVILLTLCATGGGVFAKAELPNTNAGQPGTVVVVYDSTIPGYFKYINERFAFSIDFPCTFSVAFAPANGDGARFRLPDGSAELTVSGGHNTLEQTLDEYYAGQIQSIAGEIGYTDKGGDWFVVTWKQEGRIYYRKQFVSDLYQNGFLISYPMEQKEAYDEVIINLERTFTPGWKTGYQLWG